MSEDSLKVRIDELEIEIEKQELEIDSYLNKIEHLEDKIMRLEAIVSDYELNKKKKDAPNKSNIVIVLESTEKELRELKDRMGFLRREKIQLQQQLEKLMKNGDSSVIRIEEKNTQD